MIEDIIILNSSPGTQWIKPAPDRVSQLYIVIPEVEEDAAVRKRGIGRRGIGRRLKIAPGKFPGSAPFNKMAIIFNKESAEDKYQKQLLHHNIRLTRKLANRRYFFPDLTFATVRSLRQAKLRCSTDYLYKKPARPRVICFAAIRRSANRQDAMGRNMNYPLLNMLQARSQQTTGPLYDRARGKYSRIKSGGIFCQVRFKLRCKVLRCLIIRFFIGPGIAGI